MTTGSAEMRILTVRQPWAWAIIHGGKDVENRSTNLAGDYRGPIAIHAGLRTDETGMRDRLVRRVWRKYGRGDWLDAAFIGAILGVVDLVGVHPAEACSQQQSDGDWLACSEWAERTGFHLELANPRPLHTPIPYTGALGLRNLPSDITQQIVEGIEK